MYKDHGENCLLNFEKSSFFVISWITFLFNYMNFVYFSFLFFFRFKWKLDEQDFIIVSEFILFNFYYFCCQYRWRKLCTPQKRRKLKTDFENRVFLIKYYLSFILNIFFYFLKVFFLKDDFDTWNGRRYFFKER